MIELDTSAGSTPSADLVKDVSEATFMADVVEASKTAPVIVDFWAPWCGPCKTLGPALEAAVAKKNGKVRMAKINVDENQAIAAQMQIQSIPAVFAFVDGQPVDGFMGALPGSEIDAFLDKVIQMGGGEEEGLDAALEAANEMLAEGAVADAAQTYAAVLAEEPQNTGALAGMARSYLALDDLEKAQSVMESIPEELKSDQALLAVAAEIDLKNSSAEAGEVAELRAAKDADPSDKNARLELGMALAGNGDHEAAIEELLELFRMDQEWNDGAAKEQMFKIFDMLGPKDPVAQSGRRRLSSIIFA